MDHERSWPAQPQEPGDTVERLERSLRQAELEIAARDARFEEMRVLMRRMRSSQEWKIASRLGQVAEAMPPDGTRRRAVLRRMSRVTRRLMDMVMGEERRILVIDHRLPSPDRDSGSLRMVELIRLLLSRGHRVTFIPDNLLAWPPYYQDLQSMGVEVICPPSYPSVVAYLECHGRALDLAIVCRAGIAIKHFAALWQHAPGARLVFDTVDLHFLREEREAELVQDPGLKAAVAIRREQELSMAKLFDLTLVVSRVEKEILERECPGVEVMVIPNIHTIDPAEPPGFELRQDIVFIGGFAHAPNVDAVLYFAREIFPRIHPHVPDAVFKVIGPEAPTEIADLEGPHIRILGHVPDVKPLFDRAVVSVAPLRYGAGVKGKVNQSMALGVPCVVTSLAAEGMHVVHGQDAMIADDPQAFADAVVRLCRSPDLWRTLSKNGRRNVQQHFSAQIAAERVDEMLEWAGLTRSARPVAGRLSRRIMRRAAV
jgi:glycosyltransferase involved in cell wall biosynthesis